MPSTPERIEPGAFNPRFSTCSLHSYLMRVLSIDEVIEGCNGYNWFPEDPYNVRVHHMLGLGYTEALVFSMHRHRPYDSEIKRLKFKMAYIRNMRTAGTPHKDAIEGSKEAKDSFTLALKAGRGMVQARRSGEREKPHKARRLLPQKNVRGLRTRHGAPGGSALRHKKPS